MSRESYTTEETLVTGVGCHSLLQGIFLTQGPNLGLLHCRQILYHLSHQESPYMYVYVYVYVCKYVYVHVYVYI